MMNEIILINDMKAKSPDQTENTLNHVWKKIKVRVDKKVQRNFQPFNS